MKSDLLKDPTQPILQDWFEANNVSRKTIEQEISEAIEELAEYEAILAKSYPGLSDSSRRSLADWIRRYRKQWSTDPKVFEVFLAGITIGVPQMVVHDPNYPLFSIVYQ